MITNPCTISYVKVFKPEPNPSGVMKHSCQLLIDKTDTKGVEKVKTEIARAVTRGKDKKWGGKVPPFKNQPLRDGDQELKDGLVTDPIYKSKFFLNVTSNEDQPPGVVDVHGDPLMDKSMLYSGCVVRADIAAFPFKQSGNNGVGWYLNNIMLISDGPRLDGKMNAMDAFKEFIEEAKEVMESDDLT